MHDSPDRSALAAIARAGRGRVLGVGDSPFDGPRQVVTTNVAPWLLTAALALFVSAIAGRGAMVFKTFHTWAPRIGARWRAVA